MTNQLPIQPRRIYLYKSKFFYLLLSFIAYFIGTACLANKNSYHGFALSTMFSFIIIFCIYTIADKREIKRTILVLALLAIVTHWSLLLYYSHALRMVATLTSLTFLLYIFYAVLESVTRHEHVSADSLLGAICGYFLLGICWALFYLVIAGINPNSFTVHIQGNSIHSNVQHFYYFSFATMTTLGYGDILPLSNFARTCAWLEAIVGQIYLAVWISQLVGLRIAQQIHDQLRN